MKYIIGRHPVTDWDLIMVFDDQLIHSEMAKGFPLGADITGAGQCIIVDDHINCFGTSTSLGIGPSPEDEERLRLFLLENLSALEINNLKTLKELES